MSLLEFSGLACLDPKKNLISPHEKRGLSIHFIGCPSAGVNAPHHAPVVQSIGYHAPTVYANDPEEKRAVKQRIKAIRYKLALTF